MPRPRKPRVVSNPPQEPVSLINPGSIDSPTPIFDRAMRAAEAKREREKEKEAQIENEDQYRMALNAFAGSPNGAIVLKPWIRFMKVFAVPSTNGMERVEQDGMRRFYLKMIRPYLKPEVIMEIENV